MGFSVFRVPQRLYWVADRTRLVRHGDPEAAFLAFPAGQELSHEEARRFGLLSVPTDPAPAEKARAAAPVNKLGPRPADKAATKSIVEKEL